MVAAGTRDRSLAVAGSVLIAYIGLCHEFVGAIVYPFGPATFGGPVGWHGFGFAVVLIGVVLLGGVLGVGRVPVVVLSGLCAFVGVSLTVYAAIAFERFHFFAASAVLAALTVAACHRPVQTDGPG